MSTVAGPGPGQVRVIVFDGERYASVDVERAQLERWPELAVATVGALLGDLGGR